MENWDVTTLAMIECFEALLMETKARKATNFVDSKTIVKITRRHPYNNRKKHDEFVLTIGRPNSTERKSIKFLVKTGTLFPVPRLTFYPERK